MAARTRELLLEAAGDLFEERGYSRVTIDAVVEQAGYTRGAFYAHFSDKADLFSTLLETTGSAELNEIQAALATNAEDAYPKVQRYFDSLSLDSRWRLAAQEFWAVAAQRPDIRERWLARHETIRSIIVVMLERYCEESGLTLPLPVEKVAALILCIADGISTQSALDPSPLPEDAFTTTVMYFWLGLTASN